MANNKDNTDSTQGSSKKGVRSGDAQGREPAGMEHEPRDPTRDSERSTEGERGTNVGQGGEGTQ